MFNNSITSIKAALLKTFDLNRFEKVLHNSFTFVININITKTFVIDYRLTYLNVKNVINFALMKIKSYYDKHY